MKYIVLIFLFFQVSFKSSSQITDSSFSNGCKTKFIIISNIGASNFSVAPILISCDSIKNIDYKKGDYGLHIKYHSYWNYVIDSSSYKKLFSYLDIYKTHRERTQDSLKNNRNILIIDFRSDDENDFELLSFTEISSAIFFIKQLHCFLSNNKYDKQILAHLETLYSGLLKYHDSKNEIFELEINCP